LDIWESEGAVAENAEAKRTEVYRPAERPGFSTKAFLKDGRIKGYPLYSSDGKLFLVKYSESLTEEGYLKSLVVWLIDPSISSKDIVQPSYVSDTFSHFFAPHRAFEDHLGQDKGGLKVAEIELEAEKSGLFFLIEDLNYKHISNSVLRKYYDSHQGQYARIGQSMIGIAGRILNEVYGVKFLGVKTDKTKGFYWAISGCSLKRPAIPILTKQLDRIKDIDVRRKIRENLYISIIKGIILRRFDPYVTCCNTTVENAWESHCSAIHNIFSDNKTFLSQLLYESEAAVTGGGVDKFINQIMRDYRAKNIKWFITTHNGMQRLIEAQQAGSVERKIRIIDELMGKEEDPIARSVLENSKDADKACDNAAKIRKNLSNYSRIFPVYDLSRMDEIEIGIELRRKVYSHPHKTSVRHRASEIA
jgi:hypothetical protein